MGAWGVGVFEDDFACDVREAYLAALREDPETASKKVLRSFGKMDDDDEGPIYWFALAATQFAYGRLDERVKKKALALIDKGKDAATWLEGGVDKRRAMALAKLGKQLRGTQPKAKLPKKATLPKTVFGEPCWAPDGDACASVSQSAGLTQIGIEIRSRGGGGGIFAAMKCPLADIALRWRGNGGLEIRYPRSAELYGDRELEKRFFLSGRTIKLTFIAV
jgi:hypothetical protein